MSERVERAEGKLKENPYDVDAWQILIKEYANKKADEARPFYERLISQFPLNGRFWKMYIDHEMKVRQYSVVEKLFQRCLMKVLHIDLWRCYLNYVKETKASHSSFREKMAQAYDFALEKIGIDIASFPIWNDYVSFLKNVEAVGSYAENQKITAVRRVYQKGVVNPMINVDQFWRDYIAYEQSINEMIAEKMVSDRSRDYMNARRVAKEFEANTRGLNRNAPSLPPSCRPEDLKQVYLWKKYIAWEKSNPLRSEDNNLVIKRVVFAYEQCLLCLGHYPDIWCEYAAFLEDSSKNLGDIAQSNKLLEDAAAVYERAISTFLKTNMLLHFAYADFEERRNKKEKSSEIYNRLLEVKDEKFDPTLVYITYINFARRTEGIKSARDVFKKARNDPRCEYHIYEFAALMEFHCTKEKSIACKIFELGLKKYANNADYILAYIDFLTHLNEENNARVVFEKVLTSESLKPQDSLDIWNRFLKYEYIIGDLSSVIKVEKRRAAVIEKINKVSSEAIFLVDRYRFQDLFPCSQTELKALGYVYKGPTNGRSSLSSSIITPPITNATTTPTEQPASSNVVFPDFNQLVPFKPVVTSVLIPGSHSVPGGIFPPPASVGRVLALLPHPSSFHGPFVMVDELMNMFRKCNFIESERQSHKNDANFHPSAHAKLFDTAHKASSNFSGNLNSHGGPSDKTNNSKRTLGHDDDDEADAENSNPANPPSFDIYRSRQMQKRVK